MSVICAIFPPTQALENPHRPQKQHAGIKLRLLRCDRPKGERLKHRASMAEEPFVGKASRGWLFRVSSLFFLCRLRTAASWLDKAVPALCNKTQVCWSRPVQKYQPSSHSVHGYRATPCWTVLWSQSPNRSRCPCADKKRDKFTKKLRDRLQKFLFFFGYLVVENMRSQEKLLSLEL